MSDEIDYPKEYDNSGRVENSNELIDAFVSNAAAFREVKGRIADYDLVYGPQPRNQMDIFWPDDGDGKARKSRIVMFIHGGYWQRMDRSSFSHLAAGLNTHGVAVAMPSYTLCPDIRIDGIIVEIRRACLMLYQTYRQSLTVVGHSAGGHLAACMMATDWDDIHSALPENLVVSGMGISGLYDLMPLTKTPVNDAMQMDEEAAYSASPLHWVPDALQKFEAVVGSEESSEYHRQSRELAERWSLLGTPTNYVSEQGENHFSIVDALQHPDSFMVKRLLEILEEPGAPFEFPEPDEAIIATLLQEFGKNYPNTETAQETEKPKGKSKRPTRKSGPMPVPKSKRTMRGKTGKRGRSASAKTQPK